MGINIQILNSLFSLGFIVLFVYLLISGMINAKKVSDNRSERLDKSIRQLMEFYKELSEEIKLDFKSNLERPEKKAFERYLEELELDTAKRIDRLDKRTRYSIQKFYNYFQKVQLESNIRIYNMLNEKKQNELLEGMKRREKSSFNKLRRTVEKNNEIKFSKIERILQLGYIRKFNKDMMPIKSGFISLNSVMASGDLSLDNIDSDTDWYSQLITDNHNLQDLIDKSEVLMDTAGDLNQVAFNEFINNSLEFNDIFNNQDMLNQTNMQAHMQISMNESLRAITPMDFGGNMGGIGFNPSETMQNEMSQQMEQMNQQMEQMNQMNQQMEQMNQMNQQMEQMNQQMEQMNQMNQQMEQMNQMNQQMEQMNQMGGMNDMNHHNHF